MKKIGLSVILAVLSFMPLNLRAQDSVTITFMVNDDAIGAVSPAGVHTFAEGEEYSVSATAVPGYRVMGWVIKLDCDEETCTVPLDTATATLTTTADVVQGYSSYTVVAIVTTAAVYPDSLTFVIGINDPQGGYIDPYEPGVYHFGLGQSFVFHAEPNPGYEFMGWGILNVHPSYGVYQYEDAFADISYVGPVTVSNDMLGMVFQMTALFAPLEGVGEAEKPDFNAYCCDGRICLKGAEGREVSLYDIYGRMLYRGRATGTSEFYSVPASGVYLLRVEGMGSKPVAVVR